MKKAYVIGHIAIKDAEKWDQYRQAVPGTLPSGQAKLVCRGKLARVLSGKHDHQDIVIIEFSDLAAANGWFESDQYQSLIPLRLQAADIDLLIFEEDA